MPSSDALKSWNKLQDRLTNTQLDKVRAILSHPTVARASAPPQPFPSKPQFSETIYTPREQSSAEVLEGIDSLCSKHAVRMNRCVDDLGKCDVRFSQRQYSLLAREMYQFIEKFGWSHCILRKIVLLREYAVEDASAINIMLQRAGLNKKNTVVTSLLQCYAEPNNYLSAKKSIMNSLERVDRNNYARSLSRLQYQPLARDSGDLALMLQTALRCSLLDAVIIAKLNRHFFKSDLYPSLESLFKRLDARQPFPSLADAFDLGDSESEYLFLKRCSAWLEYDDVRAFRFINDNFYDAIESSYIEMGAEARSEIDRYIAPPSLNALVSGAALTVHSHECIRALQTSGNVTRSAIFNYWLHKENGVVELDRQHLLKLMGATRDLARTIPIGPCRTAARLVRDSTVKLLMLLLLARRSLNEFDDHQLRRLLQEVVIEKHDRSLVAFVEYYAKDYPSVAQYVYEVATEDFIAKLTKIAPHVGDISTIRASLHYWRAKETGDNFYADRARNIIIEHQLNKVRNEIDDNRIYVDAARFSSWIGDEIMADLSSALISASGSSGGKGGANYDEALLVSIFEKCYSSFCSNSNFGIASYLGRRIRHGTFKGQLFSSVINSIENNPRYLPLMQDAWFIVGWKKWRDLYEKQVADIIINRLHVESVEKPLGLLSPSLQGQSKQEILNAAVNAIANSYVESNSVDLICDLIIDYCWRVAEVDLKIVGSYLKSRQGPIKELKVLVDIGPQPSEYKAKLTRDLKRELVQHIDAKLMAAMNWFKKPSSVAPRASLALLFAAVVGEVRDSFPEFSPKTDSSNLDDIELIGGVYHVIYDCLYVIVYNAAKHGDLSTPVRRRFALIEESGRKSLYVEVASRIRPTDCPTVVKTKLISAYQADFSDAQLHENRSGIPKLRDLEHNCKELHIRAVDVVGCDVLISFSFDLAH